MTTVRELVTALTDESLDDDVKPVEAHGWPDLIRHRAPAAPDRRRRAHSGNESTSAAQAPSIFPTYGSSQPSRGRLRRAIGGALGA